jgi:hypothetical protein
MPGKKPKRAGKLAKQVCKQLLLIRILVQVFVGTHCWERLLVRRLENMAGMKMEVVKFAVASVGLVDSIGLVGLVVFGSLVSVVFDPVGLVIYELVGLVEGVL